MRLQTCACLLCETTGSFGDPSNLRGDLLTSERRTVSTLAIVCQLERRAGLQVTRRPTSRLGIR